MVRFHGLKRSCRIGISAVLGMMLVSGCMPIPRAPQTPPHWPMAPSADPFLNAQPQGVPQQPALAPQTAPVPEDTPQPTFDDGYSAPMPVESFRPLPMDLPPIVEPDMSINPNVQPPRLETPTIVPQDVTVPPTLSLDVKAPERKLVGEVSVFEVTLRNTGDQRAEEVVIESRFEEGFLFPGSKEKQVNQTIGPLDAGQSRELKLSLRSDRAGHHCVEFFLKAKDAKTVTKKLCVEYRDSSASLEVNGPARRMAGGNAEWNLTVLSRDVLPVSNARVLVDYDSTYLKPIGGSEGAKQELGRITWSLGKLEASERVELQVEFQCLMPVDSTCVSFKIAADDNVEQTAKSCLAIDRRQGALDVDLQDAPDPVKVGEETDYLVTITNRGLKTVHNVQVTATLPALFRASTTEVHENQKRLTAVQANVSGSLIRFDSVDVLAPDATLTYRVKAKALEAGTGRFLISVSSSDAEDGKIRLEEVSTVVE